MVICISANNTPALNGRIPSHLARMRVFTCTPVRFPGDEAFFARDSGLMSVGLGQIGIESRPIMPGPAMPGDDPRVIRADPGDLENAEWWKTLAIDGLVFYSWAAPRYNGIARAIREAGIPFLVNMDTCGLVSPLASPGDWWRETPLRLLHEGRGPFRKSLNACKALIEWMAHPVAKRRLAHYEAATVIAAVTPHGAQWIPNEARRLGRPDLAEKFIYLPHPQLQDFTYDGTAKEELVITVGRWCREDWGQKNPRLLLETYRQFLSVMPGWRAQVIGSGAPDLPRELGIDVSDLAGRLELIERVPADHLPNYYRRASIGLWTSRWEGQQGTAAQALCCGCSVVSVFSALNSCFRHYISRESGRLASSNQADSLATELILEAESWQQGQRDPEHISRVWNREFHAPEVARKAIASLGLS